MTPEARAIYEKLLLEPGYCRSMGPEIQRRQWLARFEQGLIVLVQEDRYSGCQYERWLIASFDGEIYWSFLPFENRFEVGRLNAPLPMQVSLGKKENA